MNPSREIFFNVDTATIAALYFLMLVPIGAFGYGIFKRVSAWRRGQSVHRHDRLALRFWRLLVEVFTHVRIARRSNRLGGLSHALIFSGFLTLLIGTFLVMLEADIAKPIFGISFLHGVFYLVFKLAMNIAGLVLILGVLVAFYRRLIIRPVTLETSADDLLVLVFLLVLPIQGFILQALRMSLVNEDWAAWSFMSYPLALVLRGVSNDLLQLLHQWSWWAHMITALAFIGYVTYSKMIHPFTAMANLLFRRMQPLGALEAIPDIEKAELFGVSKLEHFTWAQLMSVDACTHCGRCLEYCPTFNTGKALRPRDLILSIAGYQADRGGIFSGMLGEEANAGRFRWGKGGERDLIGGVISKEEIWDCTTCGACMEQCPVHIEHVPLVVDMRRSLVMEQNEFPAELAGVFNSLERFGNPYQSPPAERSNWTKALNRPVQEMAQVSADGTSVEYLFFVGCIGSYLSRNQQISVALARILQHAGISFAILGKEETCSGDPARRMGHEYLAQQLAAKTIDKLNKYHVKKVITGCPHCFNAIRNEYPKLGGNFVVVHHSELIAELIADGRLSLEDGASILQGKVTYHDPCYLGRYNGVLEEPRKVIDFLPNANRVEMPRNRRQSYCCGGGGGKAFMKDQGSIRINEERVREALGTGANVVATACPFCMSMIEGGVDSLVESNDVRVLDIAEIVANSLSLKEMNSPDCK